MATREDATGAAFGSPQSTFEPSSTVAAPTPRDRAVSKSRRGTYFALGSTNQTERPTRRKVKIEHAHRAFRRSGSLQCRLGEGLIGYPNISQGDLAPRADSRSKCNTFEKYEREWNCGGRMAMNYRQLNMEDRRLRLPPFPPSDRDVLVRRRVSTA